jgi:ATPase family associated with various cellular activities (AAA)
MIEPASTLGAKLQRHRVSVRSADADAMVLRNVPANARYFSKPRTNVLVRRLRPGRAYVIAVDADLAYLGTDAGLVRAFEGGAIQEGWRVISIGAASGGRFDQAVEEGLLAVGFDGEEPRLVPGGERPAAGRVVERFGVDLCGVAEPAVAAVGRGEELTSAVATLIQRQPRIPVLVGPPGVGKSHLLLALASAIRAREPGCRVVRVDVGELFAGSLLESDRESLLGAALEATSGGVVLALERIDLAVAEVSHGTALLARRVEGGARIVGTALPGGVSILECEELVRHLHVIHLGPLSLAATREVLSAARAALAAHHGIPIDECSIDAALDRARALAGALTATAVALLDAACARARVDHASVVDPTFVYLAACGFPDIDDIPGHAAIPRLARERT